MSKKRSKKPSTQIKEAQEDFWDLGDDDLELSLEGATDQKEPAEETKENSSSSKKAVSSKNTSSEKEKPQKTKSEDSESDSDQETRKSAKSKNSGNKSKKPASSKKEPEIENEIRDLEIEEFDLEEEAPRKPLKSEDTNQESKTAPTSDKKNSVDPDLEIDEFDIEDDRSNHAEYKSSDTAKTEIKSVRKKEETGSRFAKKETTPTTMIEKISLVILLGCIIGALGWGISIFLSEAPQGEVVPFKDDFPAKGENITISSVETWWKKPIRKGENADVGIVLDANLVPCAKITLSDGGSSALRVSFRNGDKELIGDTINLTVTDGKFARSGSNTVEIYSTSGFYNASKIHAYTNGDIDPWSIIISEDGNEDGALVKARISAASKTP